MITRSRSGADTFSRASSVSPGPAMSSRSPGRCVPSVSKARSRTSSPLRGSSIRPRNPRAPPAPRPPANGAPLPHPRPAPPAGQGRRTPPPAPPRPAPARRGPPLLIPAPGHAVGDEPRAPAGVLDQGGARRLGYGYPSVDLLQGGPQGRGGGVHHPRPRRGGVHGGHNRAVRDPAGQQRETRSGGLVHVQHVERALLDPPPHPAGRQEAEREPGHRAVVRDRDGTAG